MVLHTLPACSMERPQKSKLLTSMSVSIDKIIVVKFTYEYIFKVLTVKFILIENKVLLI